MTEYLMAALAAVILAAFLVGLVLDIAEVL